MGRTQYGISIISFLSFLRWSMLILDIDKDKTIVLPSSGKIGSIGQFFFLFIFFSISIKHEENKMKVHLIAQVYVKDTKYVIECHFDWTCFAWFFEPLNNNLKTNINKI